MQFVHYNRLKPVEDDERPPRTETRLRKTAEPTESRQPEVNG